VGHVHERVDFWVEHFHPDPYVRGILDQGFKVPVDWLHAFPDGRHLGGVFKSFKQLKARTRSWGVSPKDAFAGKWVVFLALEIDSWGDGGSLESVVSHSRCFGRLFGYDCVR
jgi:hypothetical protein